MKYTAIHSPTAIDDFTILAPMGGNVSFKVLTPVKKRLSIADKRLCSNSYQQMFVLDVIEELALAADMTWTECFPLIIGKNATVSSMNSKGQVTRKKLPIISPPKRKNSAEYSAPLLFTCIIAQLDLSVKIFLDNFP